MSDSTNVEKPGTTGSESSVGPAIKQAVGEAKGRVVLATFASNVSRIQMAVDAALAFKRKVCVFGRSMVNVVGIAREMGYLKARKAHSLNRKNLTATETTASASSPQEARANRWQASPAWQTAATVRYRFMPRHRHHLCIPDPGQRKQRRPHHRQPHASRRTRRHQHNTRVHVSGHGSQEDLKTMLSLVHPKFFIPVHGEYRMLCSHAELAESLASRNRTSSSEKTAPSSNSPTAVRRSMAKSRQVPYSLTA